jgi:hypothetical protein
VVLWWNEKFSLQDDIARLPAIPVRRQSKTTFCTLSTDTVLSSLPAPPPQLNTRGTMGSRSHAHANTAPQPPTSAPESHKPSASLSFHVSSLYNLHLLVYMSCGIDQWDDVTYYTRPRSLRGEVARQTACSRPRLGPWVLDWFPRIMTPARDGNGYIRTRNHATG